MISVKELWLDVEGYENLYQVSNLGKVRSLPRKVPFCHYRGKGLRESPGKELLPDTARGYLRVTFSKEGSHKRFLVHHLVLAAFVGPCPEGMECCHKDGNRTNNCVDNLRWDTHKGNHEDDLHNGHRVQGEKQGLAKLTDEKVRQMRSLFDTGNYYLRELSAMFNINIATVHKIVKRTAWKHVK